ncbi:enoyl-CoA hydratase/isomerase family protein [Streptacidiphilus sp. PB12-B1b]|uniref:enoyl-CoA hydratase-related protein n=1 Tax=Streptacidiphilus sp. PB12-B1b TaxID=2705012 RepID=UPI0015FE3145|nr:enoyl-CoA hydratase-related protein [Streptacidiphilus sp. PB12-B1b]QMU77277.1 enoyl-CoA hydratase/isomerase family protein [Streptacidiphilus sp. PB12-B1b]
MPKLTRSSHVFLLDLGSDENRFHPDWIAQVHAALDEVEAAEEPKALVTTADGKFWSNGLDLEWLGAHPEQLEPYIASVHRLLARFLALPVPSVAAIQGHCFAAGAMLALAHDLRVMRGDRGYFCLPEVDLHIPFTPGMSALIRARLTPQTAHVAMTTARRYGGVDALAASIVDATATEDALLTTAHELAAPLATKASATLGTIKSGIYQDVLALLRDEPADRP